MYKLALIILLICAALGTASPRPSQAEIYATATTTSSGLEPTFTVSKRRETKNCNQDDRLKKIEAQAWADAGAMAEIAENYDSGNEWQPAMSYWMGADSTKSENFWKIRAALENEKNIHHPNSLFPEAVVDIYCGDTHPTKKKICRKRTNPRDPKGPKVTQFATSWVSRGWFYNTYNIFLCDRFFTEKTSLESILHDMSTGAKKGSNASEYKFSWGHTIYHELMHLNPVISNEEVFDPAYGACPVAKLANQNGCSGNILWTPPGWDNNDGKPHSLINADSWAFYASGAYFQKGANLTEPGRPINDCGIYSGQNLHNFTMSGLEYEPEGILLPDDNRTDGIFYSKVPPDPAPENTPPDDPPTPSLPYVASDLPSDLATPFDAGAYFATFTPASVSISTVPSPPSMSLFSSSLPPSASSTPTSSSPPAPSCSSIADNKCQCTDGSTPEPDEDNRCCLYHQPNGDDQCFPS